MQKEIRLRKASMFLHFLSQGFDMHNYRFDAMTRQLMNHDMMAHFINQLGVKCRML